MKGKNARLLVLVSLSGPSTKDLETEGKGTVRRKSFSSVPETSRMGTLTYRKHCGFIRYETDLNIKVQTTKSISLLEVIVSGCGTYLVPPSRITDHSHLYQLALQPSPVSLTKANARMSAG